MELFLCKLGLFKTLSLGLVNFWMLVWQKGRKSSHGVVLKQQCLSLLMFGSGSKQRQSHH
jgi:hypothetical protein